MNTTGTMLSTSVLIPSFGRPEKLRRCLESLACQSVLPSEVVVVWQQDDHSTRDTVQALAETYPCPLRLLHLAERNIVASENAALHASQGEIILLIDDDAVAPPHWIERHLAFYAAADVGAVGGSANNFWPDGRAFDKRTFEPVGILRKYGKTIGNMHDHPDQWKDRAPVEVNHLVGYNFSFRRRAIEQFETGLREYWQLFELDACLTIAEAGYKVIFDFSNTVDHHPTNPTYHPGRANVSQLEIKVFNGAYNRGFVLGKHQRGLNRILTLGYLFIVGTTAAPGLLTFPVAVLRNGNPFLEFKLLLGSLEHGLKGWRDGSRLRKN